MKYIQYGIVTLFLALSGFVSASGLPISNDNHKRNVYWNKVNESEAIYNELISSLVPCPPPFIEGTRLDTTIIRSNKAKANPVVLSKAVKRPLEHPLTRESSLVAVMSNQGVRLRRRVRVNQQNPQIQQNQAPVNNTIVNQTQVNNTVVNQQNS